MFGINSWCIKFNFLQSQNGCVLFFVCRVSLGERLQHEESSGVIRSTGSSSGEKEITFQLEKVKKGHLSQFNVTGLTDFYKDSLKDWNVLA